MQEIQRNDELTAKDPLEDPFALRSLVLSCLMFSKVHVSPIDVADSFSSQHMLQNSTYESLKDNCRGFR